MTLRVITANRLGDGLVVFLAKDGRWTETILEAQVIESEGELEKRLLFANSVEQADFIVGPYEVEVTRCEEDSIRPTRYRERIRAYGPSTHADFARQKVDGHWQHLDDVSPVYLNGVV